MSTLLGCDGETANAGRAGSALNWSAADNNQTAAAETLRWTSEPPAGPTAKRRARRVHDDERATVKF